MRERDCLDAAEKDIIRVVKDANGVVKLFVKLAHDEHARISVQLGEAILVGELQQDIVIVVLGDANGHGARHASSAHHGAAGRHGRQLVGSRGRGLGVEEARGWR